MKDPQQLETPSRRTVLKGIGGAGLSLTYVGQVSADDGEKVQYLVVGKNSADEIERAGFEVKREIAGGEVLTVVGPKDSAADLRNLNKVKVAEPDAKFEVELQETDMEYGFDDEGLERMVPDQDADEGNHEPVTRDPEQLKAELPDPAEVHDVEAVDADGPAPSWANQWDKQVSDVDAAHDYATGDGSKIAVVDTGIAAWHPDLEDNINVEDSQLFTSPVMTPCFLDPWDIDGHGTHVGGIAAGSPGYDTHPSIVGTAPDAELVSVRVFWFENYFGFCLGPYTSTSDILAGIDHAAEVGADAANVSLGTDPLPPEANADGVRVAYQKVIQHATKEGTVVVASAGNSAADLQHGGYFTVPNSTAPAMSISASAPNDELAQYSNYGTNEIDVGAPGGTYETLEKTYAAYEEWQDAGSPSLITDDPREPGDTGTLWLNADGEPTTSEVAVEEKVDFEIPEWPYPFNLVFSSYMDPLFFLPTWSWLAGTSMSAPQVCGLAALVRELDPSANANQVEQAIKHGAEGTSGKGDPELGAGRLNARETVERVADH